VRIGTKGGVGGGRTGCRPCSGISPAAGHVNGAGLTGGGGGGGLGLMQIGGFRAVCRRWLNLEPMVG